MSGSPKPGVHVAEFASRNTSSVFGVLPDGLQAWVDRYLALAVAGVRSDEVARKIELHLRRFGEYLIELDLRWSSATRRIDLPDGGASVVISNLVLCTVDKPETAIDEIHRILTPGGRLLFIEHVAATGRFLGTLPRLVKRPWRYAFEGCEVDRDTEQAIRKRFESVELDRFTAKSPFIPVNSQIAGVATKTTLTADANGHGDG